MSRFFLLSIFIWIVCAISVAQQVPMYVHIPAYYRCKVIYTVSMPIANIDTRYDIEIAGAVQYESDTILLHRYILSYMSPDRPSLQPKSFSFDDTHYSGNAKVLFTELTPTGVAMTISRLYDDFDTHITHCTDTVVEGVHCHVLTATQYCNFDVARRTFCAVDATTRLPLLLRIENNPDMPTAQRVEARYIESDTAWYDFSQWCNIDSAYTNNK